MQVLSDLHRPMIYMARPVRNAFDAGKSITWASGRGLGPGNRDFWAPNGTRRTARCHFTGPKKVPISAIILTLQFFQHLHIFFVFLIFFCPFSPRYCILLKISLGKSNCNYFLLYILIVATVYIQFLLQSTHIVPYVNT